MKRTFDLLSMPLAPGQSAPQHVVLPWKNPRNLTWSVPPEVADRFEIGEATLSAEGKLDVTVTRKQDGDAEHLYRFACIIECETDEDQEQAPRDHPATWVRAGMKVKVDQPPSTIP